MWCDELMSRSSASAMCDVSAIGAVAFAQTATASCTAGRTIYETRGIAHGGRADLI
jgi:hypothetical protein